MCVLYVLMCVLCRANIQTSSTFSPVRTELRAGKEKVSQDSGRCDGKRREKGCRSGSEGLGQ